MIKSVIFDFNGTLLFDDVYHDIAWNSMFLDLTGKGITHEELAKNFNGYNNVQSLAKAIPGKDSEWYEAMSEEKERRYREELLKIPGGPKLVDGAYDLFDWLKQKKILMFIVTASIRSNVQFFVETFGLDQWFDWDHIILDDGTYPGKTEMFAEAMRRMGNQETLIFEDSKAGILAADANHAKIVAIENPAYHELYAQCSGFLFSIKDFTGIEDRLRPYFES